MDKESVVLDLVLALRKAEKADRMVKYDVLVDRVQHLIEKYRPLPPIKNWRNGHIDQLEEGHTMSHMLED